MKSFWDKYSTLHCSYYRIPIDRESLFTGDYTYNCREFIIDHFHKGLKREAVENLIFENDFQEKYAENGKYTHTVDLYLLGILAQKTIANPVIQYVIDSIGYDVLHWYSFNHLWYLLCFYHDVSSCIERGFSENTENSVQKQLSYSLRQSNIIYDPYGNEVLGAKAERRKKRELAENYYLYRRDRGVIEHGIVGGYVFYNNLFNIWKKERAKAGRDSFKIGNVVWRKELFDLFAIISDVIIRHNMWTVAEGSKAAVVYREYELNDLIVSDKDPQKNKISFYEQPLHFLFYLLDSIEPIKRFEGNAQPRTILDNTYISFQSDSITLGWSANLEGIRGFGSWRKSIEELPDWLYVSLSDCWNNNRIREQRITFL